jgi:nucleoid-associated protein YgaU
MMDAKSIVRIAVPAVMLVLACGTLAVVGITHGRRWLPAQTAAVTATPAISPPASGIQDNGSGLAKAQAEANAVAAALATTPGSTDAGDKSIPAFDVARIEKTGDAVIAGRAAPGATVELLRNGEVHDRAVADAAGQFVMVPPRLPAGDYELTLRSSQPDGRQETSRQSVAVALAPSLTEQPVVALMTPDKPTLVLSKPAGANPISGSVAVETVETEASGKLHVGGRSPAGAAVRLYLNDSFLASTTAAADGRFAFTINGGVAPGKYRVRLDEVAPGSGAVRSRAEVPFTVPETVAASRSAPRAVAGAAAASASAGQPAQHRVQLAKRQDLAASQEPDTTGATTAQSDARASSAVVVPRISTAVVSRGDSLWRISQSTYGNGKRFAVIYEANQRQIRNPNLIYPGQTFVLPTRAR